MFTFLEIFIFISIFFTVASFYWYITVPKNLPPGPTGLPFIGSSIDYLDGANQHLVLNEQIKKYGPLMKMYIGNKLVVILGDYESVQEALVKQGDIFSGRPPMYAFIPPKCRNMGIIFSEGDMWREHRRFALSTLRDFGVGRPILENRIREEIDYLTDQFVQHSLSKTAFDPQVLVTAAVSNIINQLIFGRRFEYDDKEFVKQFTGLSRRASASGIGFLSPFLLVDWLSKIALALPMVRRVKKEASEFVDYVEEEMKKTTSTFDPDSEPSNYIHAYLKHSQEKKENFDAFAENQLVTSVLDLFMAGTETTSTTIRWAILLLAHYPEIQEKLYEEIKEQVGVESLPNYADRVKLPFTEAVIMETQRMANLTPFGVPRRTMTKTTLMGYDIPEGTMVLPYLTNVLHNKDNFPNPQKFDPYRFLDQSGKVNRDPKLIPFQAGKRICLGEPLARMELFFFFVGLVSRFRFYFPNSDKKPTLTPVVGMSCTPAAYQVCVEKRND